MSLDLCGPVPLIIAMITIPSKLLMKVLNFVLLSQIL